MLKHLQQLNSRKNRTGSQARVVFGSVFLKANFALLLALAIIPTLSGVALIA